MTLSYQTIRNNLNHINSRKLVIVNGGVRDKEDYSTYKVRKATLISLMSMGLITLDGGEVKITPKGRKQLQGKKGTNYVKSASQAQKDFRIKKTEDGYVYRGRWVHKDDLAEFDEFIMTRMKT